MKTIIQFTLLLRLFSYSSKTISKINKPVKKGFIGNETIVYKERTLKPKLISLDIYAVKDSKLLKSVLFGFMVEAGLLEINPIV